MQPGVSGPQRVVASSRGGGSSTRGGWRGRTIAMLRTVVLLSFVVVIISVVRWGGVPLPNGGSFPPDRGGRTDAAPPSPTLPSGGDEAVGADVVRRRSSASSLTVSPSFVPTTSPFVGTLAHDAAGPSRAPLATPPLSVTVGTASAAATDGDKDDGGSQRGRQRRSSPRLIRGAEKGSVDGDGDVDGVDQRLLRRRRRRSPPRDVLDDGPPGRRRGRRPTAPQGDDSDQPPRRRRSRQAAVSDMERWLRAMGSRSQNSAAAVARGGDHLGAGGPRRRADIGAATKRPPLPKPNVIAFGDVPRFYTGPSVSESRLRSFPSGRGAVGRRPNPLAEERPVMPTEMIMEKAYPTEWLFKWSSLLSSVPGSPTGEGRLASPASEKLLDGERGQKDHGVDGLDHSKAEEAPIGRRVGEGGKGRLRSMPGAEGGEDEDLADAVDAMDILYTWANGTDWLHQFKKADVRGLPIGAGRESSRDRESGELLHSFRSVAQHMSWHRGRVILVSPGHLPHWASLDSPRMSVVHQDALAAKISHRYTFNTNTFERNMWRVPDLSPVFVHFNDDYFVGRNTTRETFVNPRGGPILLLEPNVVGGGADNVPSLEKTSKVWLSGVFHTMGVVHDALGRSKDNPRYFVKHSPFVYCRAMLEHFSRRYETQSDLAARNPFRAHRDVLLPFLHHAFAMEAPDAPRLFNPAAAKPLVVNVVAAVNDNITTATAATATTTAVAPSFWPSTDKSIRTPSRALDVVALSHRLLPSCPQAVSKIGAVAESSLNILTNDLKNNERLLGNVAAQKPTFFALNDGFTNPLVSQRIRDFLTQFFKRPAPEFERSLSSMTMAAGPSETPFQSEEEKARFKKVDEPTQEQEDDPLLSAELLFVNADQSCASLCGAVRSAIYLGFPRWRRRPSASLPPPRIWVMEGNSGVTSQSSLCARCRCHGGRRAKRIEAFKFNPDLVTCIPRPPLEGAKVNATASMKLSIVVNAAVAHAVAAVKEWKKKQANPTTAMATNPAVPPHGRPHASSSTLISIVSVPAFVEAGIAPPPAEEEEGGEGGRSLLFSVRGLFDATRVAPVVFGEVVFRRHLVQGPGEESSISNRDEEEGRPQETPTAVFVVEVSPVPRPSSSASFQRSPKAKTTTSQQRERNSAAKQRRDFLTVHGRWEVEHERSSWPSATRATSRIAAFVPVVLGMPLSTSSSFMSRATAVASSAPSSGDVESSAVAAASHLEYLESYPMPLVNPTWWTSTSRQMVPTDVVRVRDIHNSTMGVVDGGLTAPNMKHAPPAAYSISPSPLVAQGSGGGWTAADVELPMLQFDRVDSKPPPREPRNNPHTRHRK